MPRRRATPSSQKIPRLHQQDGRWYWKPEKTLRPHWRNEPLGLDEARARAEARRLNKMASDWLATERPAAAAPRRAQPRTVGELIELWRNGPLKDKAPRTQKQYDYELKRLHAEFGHEPAATLDTVRVDDWADTLRKTAPSTLRVVAGRGRSIFQWAGRKGYIARAHNPFREMNLPGGGRRKFRFTWADVLHICAVAAKLELASLGHALAVGFMTVQRITDVLALTEDADIQRAAGGASLRFRQSKTGFDVDQEWPVVLDEMLGIGFYAGTPRLPPRQAPRGVTRQVPENDRPIIRSEITGRRWDEKYAGRVFCAKVIPAAIKSDPQKWAHLAGGQLRDGRRSGFVHGVLGGASVEIMCSLSGHTIQQGYEIVEHYLPKTRAAADKARAFMRVG